ncbi:unnamed protein product [Rangifer tarandus platyrhynchus]|uniref:Uncharacterized protein n=1 Tax=Rangifer tarandus platyrhynchus TaxID=3082113 RepID=A0ACB1MJY0_RANTA
MTGGPASASRARGDQADCTLIPLPSLYVPRKTDRAHGGFSVSGGGRVARLPSPTSVLQSAQTPSHCRARLRKC